MLRSIQLVNLWSQDGSHEFTTCEWNIFPPPSLITKWRTHIARTQLEFTALDHEFTRSMERYFTARELVITSSWVEWNAALVTQCNARNATYTSGQWHGWNLSCDMACFKFDACFGPCIWRCCYVVTVCAHARRPTATYVDTCRRMSTCVSVRRVQALFTLRTWTVVVGLTDWQSSLSVGRQPLFCNVR